MIDPKVKTSVLPRPFSVFDLNSGEFLEIVFRAVGPNTKAYAELKTNEEIGIRGPLGIPLEIPSNAERLLLIGGGCGLASLHLIAKNHPKISAVIAAFPSAEYVFGSSEFADLIGDRLVIATENGSQGVKGNAVEVFDAILQELSGCKREGLQVFTCGPIMMMKEISAICRLNSVKCFVFLEEMMCCGHGACKACAVPLGFDRVKYICQKGPAINCLEIDWDELAKKALP